MKKIWGLGLSLLILLAGCSVEEAPAPTHAAEPPLSARQACEAASVADRPGEPINWQAHARCDLLTAHEIMQGSHPGPVDEQNPGFNTMAEQALQAALARVPQVDSPQAFESLLAAYTAPFRDGHFGVYGSQALFDLPAAEDDGPRWAGVVIGARDSQLYVAHAEPGLGVTRGDRLIACDGVPAPELMHRNVFAFSHRDPASPSSWRSEARRLLRDDGNPFVELPDRCEFETADGTFELALKWRPFPQEVRRSAERASLYGSKPDVGVEEISPGVWWVQLPDFSPTTEEEIEGIKGVIAEVAANRERLAQSKAVVFDTRGNQGGSSVWGNRVLKALYGEEYVDHRTYSQGIEIHWRASEANQAHLEGLRDRFEKEEEADLMYFVTEVATGMKEAREIGEPFYIETDSAEDVPPAVHSHDVTAKTYLFTHGWCASACLDFADDALAMEGLTHIGHPTGSDSTYMEVRVETLPSGFARVVVPVKVYRNRPRGNGAYYTPQFIYDAFGWSDQSVREWFLSDVLAAQG